MHAPDRVVAVAVDEDDVLPRPELRHAADDRQDERRREDRRQQMVGAVTGGAVAMVVAPVLRQQSLDELREVRLRVVAELHHDEPGGGVRHEDVEQAVTGAATERAQLVVEPDELTSGRVDLECFGTHPRVLTCRLSSDGAGYAAHMPRAIWSGTITFGLIAIPVKLYPAIGRTDEVDLHLLHEKDGERIHYERRCEAGHKVDWDDIVRGYEHTKGKWVTFTDDELKAIRTESMHTVDVVTFVPSGDIDPMYYENTYYVSAEDAGAKAYRLLVDALESEELVGISKVAIRDRERLAAIRVDGRADRPQHDALAGRDPGVGSQAPARAGPRQRTQDGASARPSARGRVPSRGVRGRVPQGAQGGRQTQGAGQGDRRARGT